MNTYPIILAGQVYLDEIKNEYLIVTKNNGGNISYYGNGFRGLIDVDDFAELFQPVDPADVDSGELAVLLAFCPEGTEAKVGYIKED